MRKILAAVVLLMMTAPLFAQQWVESMRDYQVNFYEVQSQFETYWKATERQAQKTNENFRPGKSSYAHGWAQFRRWENFWETRVYPTGVRPNPAEVWQEMTLAQSNAGPDNIGAWTAIGPFNAPSNDGIGRINCIAFDPRNSNVVWAGTPSGGLWKSTDGGTTWSTNTDHLTNLGVSSVAIDPNHPDTMYIATGDRDGADTYSYGVLKSTDGGLTWNSTGLSYSVSQQVRVGAVHVLPTNSQVVIAASRNGMMRSVNGGITWTNIQAGQFNMLAPDPHNPNTIYAATTGNPRIFRSRDGGQTWTMLTSTLPTTGVNRVEVAVSPVDSNYIYAVYSGSDNGFFGLYRSTDAGDTWTQRSTTPNILGWNSNGSGTGGQGWYDLCIAASPENRDRIFVGGVNIWRSNSSGQTWAIVAHWTGSGAAFVHADIHCLAWKPGSNVLYAGTDGGVSRTANLGVTWDNLYNGMNITQYYKISQSATNPAVILGGAQDNGTHRLLGSTWTRVGGGDGMDNAIDPSNNNVMYSSIYYGSFRKSTNGGNNFAAMNIPPSGTGNWVTPFRIDPVNSNTLYAGYDRLWKSTNQGATWTSTSAGPIDGTNIDEFAVSPSNTQIIYVSINEKLYRSNNGGVNWGLVSQNMPGSVHITGIAIHPNNPDHVWVTRSGYTGNQKVFVSTNGGQNWTNQSNGLPNLPVNCIVYENNSLDGIYVGTDVGIYYRDASTNGWKAFFKGFPNAIVRDLEIYYPTGKIRAGTYGRGVWESPLFGSFQDQPIADFKVLPYSTCMMSDTVLLQDVSDNLPSNWQWSIYPNNAIFVNGTSSTSRNPEVVFTANGEYTVTLKVSNINGSDTKTVTRAISVGGKALPFAENFEGNHLAEQWTVNNPDQGITWQTALVGGNAPGNQAAVMDFFNYTTQGAMDELISPVLSFEGHNNVQLTFQHAYLRYDNNSNDSLFVYASSNCGSSWTLLQVFAENGTGNWVTGPNSTAGFVPQTAANWCFGQATPNCKTISLNAYSGNTGVRIKFVSKNGFGNKLYLDNINITGTATVKPLADFTSDTTGCTGTLVKFYDASTMNPTSWSWSFPGGSPATSNQASPSILYSAAGQYSVTLIVSNAVGSDTIVKTAYIDIDAPLTPTVAISTVSSSICSGQSITFNAAVTNGGSNPLLYWYVNNSFRALAGASYTISNPSANDVVKCVLRPDLECVTTDSVVSNSITVTVLPSPAVSQTPFANVCSADAPVVLSGGSPAGGTYSGTGVSNGIFDPAVAGVGAHIITYSYTSTNGCASSATQVMTVSNAPVQPSVSYSNFVLKASPVSPSYTYQWLDAQLNPIPGATDTVFVPTTIGNYAVQIRFLNGCTNTSAFYNVSQIGIDELTLKSGLNLYPNPVDNDLQVSFVMSSSAEVTISISDMTGRTVHFQTGKMNAGEQKITINTSALAAGAYMIELSDGENRKQQKFVKR